MFCFLGCRMRELTFEEQKVLRNKSHWKSSILDTFHFWYAIVRSTFKSSSFWIGQVLFHLFYTSCPGKKSGQGTAISRSIISSQVLGARPNQSRESRCCTAVATVPGPWLRHSLDAPRFRIWTSIYTGIGRYWLPSPKPTAHLWK